LIRLLGFLSSSAQALTKEGFAADQAQEATMSVAEVLEHRRAREASPPPEAQAGPTQMAAWENFVRSPHTVLRLPGRPPMRLATDRVRARPAVTPQLSMMIGMTAIGLGIWGSLFPRSVKRTLGITAPTAAIVSVFGARELWSGFKLAEDPTRIGVLWARVGADVFDIAALAALNNPANPKRRNARLALGAVLAISALDVLTAVRMSTVQRNCA
jgi:hypothetical protein